MSFGHGKFNHTAFNTGSGQGTIWLAASGKEIATAIISVAENTYIFVTGTEVSQMEIVMAAGKFVAATGTETATAQLEIVGYIFLSNCLTEKATNDLTIGSDSFLTTELTETAGKELLLGENAFLTQQLSETAEENLILGARTFLAENMYEIATAILDVYAFSEYITILNVTLQPGETIVVDAANFEVLKDNVDADDVIAGDWLDALARNTESIQVSCGTTNALQATIYYQELYY